MKQKRERIVRKKLDEKIVELVEESDKDLAIVDIAASLDRSPQSISSHLREMMSEKRIKIITPEYDERCKIVKLN